MDHDELFNKITWWIGYLYDGELHHKCQVSSTVLALGLNLKVGYALSAMVSSRGGEFIRFGEYNELAWNYPDDTTHEIGMFQHYFAYDDDGFLLDMAIPGYADYFENYCSACRFRGFPSPATPLVTTDITELGLAPFYERSPHSGWPTEEDVTNILIIANDIWPDRTFTEDDVEELFDVPFEMKKSTRDGVDRILRSLR